MPKANQVHIKTHNNQLVLSTIYEQGPLSRAEIVHQTHLTAPTVSDLVTPLLAVGLVEEVGFGLSKGGKRPILLQVIDDARFIIGLDLGREDFRGALINLKGKVIYHNELPLQSRTGDAALGIVYELINDLIQHSSSPLLGIGIGAPGLVDSTTGIIRRAVNVEWQDIPLAALLKERFNLPVYMANDCQVAALAEYTYHNQAAVENLVVINAGYGIGAGIIIKGQALNGVPFGAGEIGHVQVVRPGEPCQCGNTGCLETLVSTRAILQQVQALRHGAMKGSLPEVTHFDQICRLFKSGDPLVQTVVNAAGHYLGAAIANTVSVLGPSRVTLSGSLSSLGEPFLDILREEISRRCRLPTMNYVTVDISSLGPDIVLLGASAQLLSHELGINRASGTWLGWG
jgi:predicted NBD/HSP70 family sugar kinase